MSPTEVDDWSARCEAFVRQRMAGDPAHDTEHVRRVVAWARRLALSEGARLGVVVPAAWLHDVVTVAKDAPDRARASQIAAEEASRWLRAEGFPEADVPAVVHAVEAHSFTAGIEPRTIEAEVVQDADRLDALGAIGLARMYAMSAVFGSRIVHPDDPVPATPPTRDLDDKRWATDHLFVKLLRLPETMRTQAGRVEAERRAVFLRQFLRQLTSEVG